MRDHLHKDVVHLDVIADGTFGQLWTHVNINQFAQFVTPASRLYRAGLVTLHLWRGEVGHTYMVADTEGGRVIRAMRMLLRDPSISIHVVFEYETLDPDAGTKIPHCYSLEGVVNSLANFVVVKMELSDFQNTSATFAASKIYETPSASSCDLGPHKFF